MKTIAFFNSKGGVGTTSLVYKLAWMCADMGLSVVAADLDPQAHLTAMFLDEGTLVPLLEEQAPARKTIYGALGPLWEGAGDAAEPYVEAIAPGLALLIGDLALATAEDEYSRQWTDCLEGRPEAFRVLRGLRCLWEKAARQTEADLVLVDVGPGLGALNRAALVAADKVALPLAPDLYALQILRNVGPTLKTWRAGWRERLKKAPASLKALSLPRGAMEPIGYVVLQREVRLDRPVNAKAYKRRLGSIPRTYSRSVLNAPTVGGLAEEPYCLAAIKHYSSLASLAQEARKPMFRLEPADGATDSYLAAVTNCYHDFRSLAGEIARRCSITLPDSTL